MERISRWTLEKSPSISTRIIKFTRFGSKSNNALLEIKMKNQFCCFKNFYLRFIFLKSDFSKGKFCISMKLQNLEKGPLLKNGSSSSSAKIDGI